MAGHHDGAGFGHALQHARDFRQTGLSAAFDRQRRCRSAHDLRLPIFMVNVVAQPAGKGKLENRAARLAGVAIFLVYLYPVLVVFIAYWLYRETPTPRKIGVALICFLGCAILSFKSNGQLSFSGRGILLILISALCIALYAAFSQNLLKKYSPTVISVWTLTPVGLIFIIMDSPNLARYADFSMAAWLIMLGAAFFATFVSLILFFGAIVRIGAAHTSLLCTIEPVSTALLARWVLGEQMSREQMLGAALILGGLIILEWPSKEKFQRPRKAENIAAPV